MDNQELISKLLGRREDRFAIHEGAWHGKTVMVTGAAGFIGAELCRCLIALDPVQIVTIDNNEERLSALMRRTPARQVKPELADICDERRMRGLFAESRPDIVFHAAAYKHVSLLEHFPFEAIENNSLATAQLAQLAQQYRTEQFIFVSTDKAVDPISIMGASKRLCEELLAQGKPGATKFVSLRCGNVLGSSGSVLPIWLEQIANGGPITVTHESAERFFVTVREAAGALIEVACLDERGLFAYGPGKPLRIAALARAVAEISRRPEPIEIRRTSMRPGERAREQLHSSDEQLGPTSVEHISRVEGSAICRQNLSAILTALRQSCEARDLRGLLGAVQDGVPAYRPSAVLQN